MRILLKDEIERLYLESEQKADNYLSKCVEAQNKYRQQFLTQNSEMLTKHPEIYKSMLRMMGSGLEFDLMRDKVELSWRARKRLRQIDITAPENQDEVRRILTHEIYIEKRIATECSRDEGRGVSSALDGLFGEKLTVFELELCIRAGFAGTILHNLEFEVGNRTIQIDVAFVTQKGVFVFETKNYDGKIHGAEYQNKWTLKTRYKDYLFNNPVMQNQTHLNVIKKVIQCPRYYSVIAFSDTSELEYIDIHAQDVYVLNFYALILFLEDMFARDCDVLSTQEMEAIINTLRQYCADDPKMNPNYKEPRGYFSARTKLGDNSNA